MTSPPELRWSRFAIGGYFFILGVAFAVWGARLPAVKESLHLSDGRLGLALFAMPAGSVLTLPVSGRIANRVGLVRMLRMAGALNPAALILLGLAPDLAVLMAALAVYGALFGLLDVSMNACAARLELGYGRPIMSSLHAGFSIAGLAVRRDRRDLGLAGHRPAAHVRRDRRRADRPRPVPRPARGAPRGPGGSGALRGNAGPHAEADLRGDLDPRPAGAVRAGRGRLAADWSAVYLHVNLGTSPGVAAVALASFSVTMAAGQLAGDRLAARFGPVRLVRASGLVAGVGMTAGLLAGSPAAAIAGFALLGAGLAGIFPQIVTVAARLDPARAAATSAGSPPCPTPACSAARSRSARSRPPSACATLSWSPPPWPCSPLRPPG